MTRKEVRVLGIFLQVTFQTFIDAFWHSITGIGLYGNVLLFDFSTTKGLKTLRERRQPSCSVRRKNRQLSHPRSASTIL